MPKQPTTDVTVRLVLENPKAYRALKVLVSVLEDVAEDFGYRDDVKRAVRAGKYLSRNVSIVADDVAGEILLANGCELVNKPTKGE